MVILGTTTLEQLMKNRSGGKRILFPMVIKALRECIESGYGSTHDDYVMVAAIIHDGECCIRIREEFREKHPHITQDNFFSESNTHAKLSILEAAAIVETHCEILDETRRGA